MALVRGGRPFYGEAIGVLVLDTVFPRIPGDIANASTFDFPVRFKVVCGASPRSVIIGHDRSLLKPFIEGAQELEREGVRAITTSCGFLAMFQQEMADAVNIPVFTSSLMQIPVVHRMLRRGKRIGIVTANSQTLSPDILSAVGVTEDIPIAVAGAENTPAFYSVFVQNGMELDIEAAEAGVVRIAKGLQDQYPDLGAFVCEGTNYSSFGHAVQSATGLPWFDIVTMTRWIYHGVVKQKVAGGFM